MSDNLFMRRNLKGLGVFGLWNFWEFKSPRKRLLFNIYGKILYIYFLFFNTSEFIDMYQVVTNIPLLMGNAGVSLLYFVTVLKSWVVYVKKDRVQRLLDVIITNEKSIMQRDEVQKRIYLDSVNQNWALTKLFWFVCFSTVSFFYIARPIEFYILGPQEVHHCRVPFIFSSWFPFDKYAPGYYELAYFMQIMGGVTGGSFTAVCDTFMVACTYFAIGQFQVIQNNIRRLHENVKEEDYDENQLIDKYEAVVEIVKEHNKIIE